MIGNDIVDWTQAMRESNWQRKGFLAKLFTREEQQLILEAANPEQMVWTLWCLKESVYKANVRLTGKRVFAPQKIACELTTFGKNFVRGTALYTDRYHIGASLTPNYVSGVAFSKVSSPVFQEVIVPLDGIGSAYQSTHLYQRIKQYSASVLSVPVDIICIQKNEVGVPTLLISDASNKPVTISLSISHHGRYGAFVIDYFQHLL